jgi:hypothetical protein
MAETPNLHLTKDASTDNYSVERVNANSDRIDAFAGQTAGSIAGLGTRAAALEASQAAQGSAIAAIGKKAGMKNLFDFEKWKSVPYTARGTVAVGDGTYSITSTANDFYTEYNPAASRPYPEAAELPTVAGKRYAFSWKADGLTAGKTYRVTIYKNGVASAVLADTVNITTASGVLEFTAPSDCQFATFRFNIAESGTSVEFSEIMYRLAGTDSAYEQFAPSNRELYEMILALQGGTS